MHSPKVFLYFHKFKDHEIKKIYSHSCVSNNSAYWRRKKYFKIDIYKIIFLPGKPARSHRVAPQLLQLSLSSAASSFPTSWRIVWQWMTSLPLMRFDAVNLTDLRGATTKDHNAPTQHWCLQHFVIFKWHNLVSVLKIITQFKWVTIMTNDEVGWDRGSGKLG